MMSDIPPEESLPVDPADRLRGKTDTPFSLPGDDEPPTAGLEQVLVQAEVDAHIFDLKSLEKSQQKKSIQNMVDLGAPAIEPLIIYLKHPDRWARMMAAEVLGKMSDQRAIPPLKEALNDTHQGVRYMAELALKEISALESAAESKHESRKQVSVPQPAKVTAPLHPPSERLKRAPARDEGPGTESKTEKPTAKGDTEPPRRVKQPTKVQDLLNQDLENLPGKIPEPIPASSRTLENDLENVNVAGIESIEVKSAVVGETYSTKEETTNCPVCRQEIKADSRICPHCRARFDISLKGYCPNCHTAVEVDPFNTVCPRCGEEVIDQHFEAVLESLGDIKTVAAEIQAEEEEIPPLPLEFKSEIEPDRSYRSGGERKSKSSTQEEFPPIDVPDLQSFTDKPLPSTEEKKQPVVEDDSGKEGSYSEVDFKFKPFDEPEEIDPEEIKPEIIEKPEPVQPEKPQVKLESSLPAEEPRQIRSMFSSTVSETEEKPSKSSPVDESVFPPVRRFAQDGGTPMYIPEGYNSTAKTQEGPEEEGQEESQPKNKAKSTSKKKAIQPSEQQGKKPAKRQPAFKVDEEEPEPEPIKKVESVFTVREYTPTPEEEVSPLAQAEVQAKEKLRREESRRGVNPWLIAAPLFLISGVLAVLIYFRTTGRQIPQLNIPGISPGLFADPTATVTPTPEPTPTQTPRPTWVSGFIDPVMTTVENEEPEFFDNFSIPDANWGFRDGNRPALSPITIENEMLVMPISRDYGFARERTISINNFVENLDFAFAQDDQSVFELVLVGSYGSLSVHLINTSEAWEGTIKVQDPKTGDWKPVQNGVVSAEDSTKMNLTVIKNGTQLAVLVDGHPMLTYQDRALPKTMFHDYYFYRGANDGIVTMTLDNIRIWDLDNYPNLPK